MVLKRAQPRIVLCIRICDRFTVFWCTNRVLFTDFGCTQSGFCPISDSKNTHFVVKDMPIGQIGPSTPATLFYCLFDVAWSWIAEIFIRNFSKYLWKIMFFKKKMYTLGIDPSCIFKIYWYSRDISVTVVKWPPQFVRKLYRVDAHQKRGFLIFVVQVFIFEI